MAKYCDIEELQKQVRERLLCLRKEYGYYDHYTDGFNEAVDVIDDFPTTDVVAVVRCKDCKHRVLVGKVPFMFYACSHNKGLGDGVREDDFCSYGAKMDGGKDETK